MKGAYQKLFAYVFSMVTLFSVIAMQWGLNGTDYNMYSVIQVSIKALVFIIIFKHQNQLFTVNTDTKNYNEEVEETMASSTDILDWLNSNVLSSIFADSVWYLAGFHKQDILLDACL